MANLLGFSPKKSGENRDERLLELAMLVRDGGERPFENIVRICEKGVFELAYKVSKNSEDAMDITQDTFIKLWQLLTGDAPLGEIKSWYSYILRMARNCALDFLRKQSIRRHDGLMVRDDDGEYKEIDIPDDDISSDPVRYYEREERIEMVREAINSLEDDYRQVLVLRESEGRSYKEISDLMGIEMGTVKSKIFRARNQIKEYLEKRNIF